jgi:hypothetical protein
MFYLGSDSARKGGGVVTKAHSGLSTAGPCGTENGEITKYKYKT